MSKNPESHPRCVKNQLEDFYPSKEGKEGRGGGKEGEKKGKWKKEEKGRKKRKEEERELLKPRGLSGPLLMVFLSVIFSSHMGFRQLTPKWTSHVQLYRFREGKDAKQKA